jgi:hypothetical protein
MGFPMDTPLRSPFCFKPLVPEKGMKGLVKRDKKRGGGNLMYHFILAEAVFQSMFLKKASI